MLALGTSAVPTARVTRDGPSASLASCLEIQFERQTAARMAPYFLSRLHRLTVCLEHGLPLSVGMKAQ